MPVVKISTRLELDEKITFHACPKSTALKDIGQQCLESMDGGFYCCTSASTERPAVTALTLALTMALTAGRAPGSRTVT